MWTAPEVTLPVAVMPLAVCPHRASVS
uniref:Uncharacterized protein n=1 Tax=Anguilla anguilla TaxID=7936 RepID=A0A0E9R7P7_ANGAN